jgi:hypothetical protein
MLLDPLIHDCFQYISMGRMSRQSAPMQAQNLKPVDKDLLHPCLHSIFSHPRLPDAQELVVLFPHAIEATTTACPSTLELQQHRSSRMRGIRRPQVTYVGTANKPTILINLELLVDTEQWSQATCDVRVPAKPGVQHICSLRPYFRVGVFCDWPEVPARAATSCLNKAVHEFLHPTEKASAAHVRFRLTSVDSFVFCTITFIPKPCSLVFISRSQ